MKKVHPKDRPALRSAEELRRRYNLENMQESASSCLTVDEAIWGESRPISSGGVFEIMGDVEEILKSI